MMSNEYFEEDGAYHDPSTILFGRTNSYIKSNPSPDTISIAGSRVPGGMGEDHIKFNYFDDKSNFDFTIDNNNGFWKYNEDKILKEVKEYLGSTYKAHYASENSKVQVLDIIEAIGDSVPFCRDNLIKYASRFGKKNGMSKMDALKIIHYGILLYHFAGLCNETETPYETF